MRPPVRGKHQHRLLPHQLHPLDGTLYYIDYECNDYMEQWDFQHWGQQYWRHT